MKKNILLSAAFMLLAMAVSAAPITLRQAEAGARAFLYGNTRKMFSPGSRISTSSAVSGIQPYYVFNIGSDEGFVIMSGDDAAYPVLGYSDRGHLDDGSIPDNMKVWLEGYARDLRKIQEMNLPARAERRGAAETWQPVEKMVTSEWNQMHPYNMKCPKYPGDFNNRPTGCVATAMAQVMYYHRWPVDETAPIKAYSFTDERAWGGDGSERFEDALDPVVFDWDAMTDTYDYYSDAEAENAVAELMKYVGHSVQMMYGVQASGAFSEDIACALINTFGYKNTAKIVYRDHYSDQMEWERLMYDELLDNRPILYSGVTKDDAGHQFVCDGYEDGFFHINWGWGGTSDGFFKLAVLDPYEQGTGGAGTGMSFSEYQSAVIGIEKPVDDDHLYTGNLDLNVGSEKQFDISLKNMRKNYISMQFDLRLPQGITIATDAVGDPKVSFNELRSEKQDHKVTVNRISEGKYRFLVFSPSNSCIKGDDGTMVKVTVKVPDDITAGIYEAEIYNVIMCNSKMEGYKIGGCVFDVEVSPDKFLLGDANMDGIIDDDDVTAITETILYRNPDKFDFARADVDSDGMLDIEDAMLAIDKILDDMGSERNIVPVEMDYDDAFSLSPTDGGVALALKNSTVYKAVQMDITLPSGITIDDILPAPCRVGGFRASYAQISEGKYRLMFYSPCSSNIMPGDGMVAEIINNRLATEAKITNIVMVTADLRKMLLGDVSYKVPTGIEEVNADEAGSFIYTLGGIRVYGNADQLEKGIYIVKGRKMVVR